MASVMRVIRHTGVMPIRVLVMLGAGIDTNLHQLAKLYVSVKY